MPPGTDPLINSNQGWHQLTKTLAVTVPKYLRTSVGARRGLRSLMRTGR